MTHDILNSIRNIPTPSPDADKKSQAISDAVAAFVDSQKESHVQTKGYAIPGRLTHIITQIVETIMDKRWIYGLSAASVCIVAFPIAISQLPLEYTANYSNESMEVSKSVSWKAPTIISDVARPLPPMELSAPPSTDIMVPSPVNNADVAMTMQGESWPSAAASAKAETANSRFMQEIAPRARAIMPSPAPYTIHMTPSVPADSFTSFTESAVKSTQTDPVSTFSIDVDTASYAFVRSMLRDGILPPADAVRIEEMVNYFPYDYAAPQDATTPFSSEATVFPAPWDDGKRILHLSIKGYEPPQEERKPVSLTFLIDTSGSMDAPNKLPLLKRSLALLLDTLDERDSISIVTYAGSAGVVLGPTQAHQKSLILNAMDRLEAGGGTAGSEGLALAYRVAEDSTIEGGVNRVLLATDGDFNLGISDPDQLKEFIERRRDMGISLSVLGFGMGNYGDDTMQSLAQNGNGNASYISDFTEARKVLVEEVGGTLETIAKDVKIQIEFNPAAVAEYRLIGYETRALATQDFNNDRVDAGDIGAGHTVTALYEITPVGSKSSLIEPLRYGSSRETDATTSVDEIAFIKLRYKLPDEDTSQLIEYPILESDALPSIDDATDNVRFSTAVAAFAQKLKGSVHVDMEWTAIRTLAAGARGSDAGGYRNEFLRVLDDASALKH